VIKSFSSDFALTSEQINELYNYVTEDGIKVINFADFRDLVLFLEENKRDQERKSIEITVTPSQYAFIQASIDELSGLKEREAFKEWVRARSATGKQPSETWSDALLDDLFHVVADFYANETSPDANALLNCINVEEASMVAGRQRKRNSTLDVRAQNAQAVETIRARVEGFIAHANGVKKRQPSEGVYELFKSFLKLSDEIQGEVG